VLFDTWSGLLRIVVGAAAAWAALALLLLLLLRASGKRSGPSRTPSTSW
jgi:hypothetical protein